MSQKNKKTEKPDFEAQMKYVERLLKQYSYKWRLSTLEWEDAAQILRIRLWQKYEQFDPERARFTTWANIVIRNTISNLLRDNLYRYARPCIQNTGCAYNTGGETCSYTKSGLQCCECKLYKKWYKKKFELFNIKMSVSTENHANEVSNKVDNGLDFDEKKKILDEKILHNLDNEHEEHLYKMLYIKGMTPLEVSETLKYKGSSSSQSSKNSSEYQMVLKFGRKVERLARDIVNREGLESYGT